MVPFLGTLKCLDQSGDEPHFIIFTSHKRRLYIESRGIQDIREGCLKDLKDRPLKAVPFTGVCSLSQSVRVCLSFHIRGLCQTPQINPSREQFRFNTAKKQKDWPGAGILMAWSKASLVNRSEPCIQLYEWESPFKPLTCKENWISFFKFRIKKLFELVNLAVCPLF